MVVEPTRAGVRVTFTRMSGTLGFAFDLSQAEFQYCVSQAMERAWDSQQGKDARGAWAALFATRGAVRSERAAFAQASAFVAEQMLSNEALASLVAAKLAEVLKEEHLRQQRNDADWRRHA